MHRKIMTALLVALLALNLAGCDKAEQAVKDSGLGLGADLTKLIGSATKALSGITDLESAKSALPALQNVDTDLGSLLKKAQELSPEKRAQIAKIVTGAMPELQGLMDKVSHLEGVGALLQPTLEAVKSKLSNLG